MSSRAEPVRAEDRVVLLDALRGFAILGILVVNVEPFGGRVFMTAEAKAALPWSGLDGALEFFVRLFFTGKFNSLFGFMLGVGLAMQARRYDEVSEFRPFFLRRMGSLFLLGLVHALFNFGDILHTYALMSLGLLLFLPMESRRLARWAVVLVLSPILIYGVLFAVGFPDPFAGAGDSGMLERAGRTLAGDDLGAIVLLNVQFVPGTWIYRLFSLTLPRIFGMFVLGLWVGRMRFLEEPGRHTLLFKRTLLLAVLLGLPANAGAVWLSGQGGLLPTSPAGFLQAALGAAGVPLLTLGYVSAFALLGNAGRRWLAPVGRLALTNYLLQTLIAAILFWGVGFGLTQRLSWAALLLVAGLVFLLQVVASRFWLRSHSQGPFERLWRRMSYR